MRCRDLAAAALVAGGLLSWPDPLAAQACGTAWLELAIGVAAKPSYGYSDSRGHVMSARAGRFLSRRAAVRVEAEHQSYDGAEPRVVDAPCPLTGPCGGSYQVLGAGPIRMVSVLASLEWYEQADRSGFYLLAGSGPQVVASHPDRRRAIRLAAQAGAGVSLASVVLVEARYQATLGARAEPRHVVLVSVGLRYSHGPSGP